MRKLLTIFGIIGLVFFAGCKKDTYVPIVAVCPVVVSTNPANGAVSVPLSQVITATFNEKMNAASITSASFTVYAGGAVAGTVSFAGSTASFAPTGGLTANTTYTATITTAVKDTLGNHLQVNYVWTFSTGALLGPSVISTDPANNATGVVLNKIVTATFSVPMDTSTITTSTFTLKQGTTAIAGAVTHTGTTASFIPTVNLLAGKVYTATITTGAKSVPGISLASNYVWTFTTGATIAAPTVISTDPVNNATGIPLTQIVTATFSQVMTPLTVTTTGNFTIKNGSNNVTGTVTYSGNTAVFTPAGSLLSNTIYTGTITTSVKNSSGIAMAANYVWTFTTLNTNAPRVISTSPANNATGVALNKVLTATFSVPMDPLTITSSTFTLKYGNIFVTGAVSYAGTTASFTPDVDLISGTVYTATITTGAKDVPGVALASNYVWTFSTVAPLGPPPVVLGTAADFGILAGVGISNNAGPSKIINMNVGISPGFRSSVTGFPPATIVNGAIYASDDIAPPGVAAMLTQAKLDLTNAYLSAQGASNPAPITVAGDQGGLTLAPGIYKSTSTLLVQSGDLTLDAQGDVNAVWIFQIASGFTTIGGAGGNIILAHGAQAKNVFWQTGSSATIGDYTAFQGNILALTSITMNSHSTAVGRMLAINAAVTMTSTNTITKP